MKNKTSGTVSSAAEKPVIADLDISAQRLDEVVLSEGNALSPELLKEQKPEVVIDLLKKGL